MSRSRPQEGGYFQWTLSIELQYLQHSLANICRSRISLQHKKSTGQIVLKKFLQFILLCIVASQPLLGFTSSMKFISKSKILFLIYSLNIDNYLSLGSLFLRKRVHYFKQILHQQRKKIISDLFTSQDEREYLVLTPRSYTFKLRFNNKHLKISKSLLRIDCIDFFFINFKF